MVIGTGIGGPCSTAVIVIVDGDAAIVSNEVVATPSPVTVVTLTTVATAFDADSVAATVNVAVDD
jgi:hypothetical protein